MAGDIAVRIVTDTETFDITSDDDVQVMTIMSRAYKVQRHGNNSRRIVFKGNYKRAFRLIMHPSAETEAIVDALQDCSTDIQLYP